jgi:subtilisin family serine protease
VNSRLGSGLEEEGPKAKLHIKVAVLDTSINLKHFDFKGQYKTGQIKSVRSWVDRAGGAEDPKAGDISGHGTFIASLLLNLGPQINLYVAQVSKSKDFKKGTSENITNVSTHQPSLRARGRRLCQRLTTAYF